MRAHVLLISKPRILPLFLKSFNTLARMLHSNNGPRREKTANGDLRTTKAQNRLCIRTV